VLALMLRGECVAAELHVLATTPRANAMAPATTSVRVELDAPVDPATVSAATFRVFGRGSGTASGTLAVAGDGLAITLTPTRPFSAGEVVLVNLSHDIGALDGTPLRAAGYAFQFTVATKPTARAFDLVDTISNRTGGPSGPQTRIYGAQATDLNGDGFLDLATVNEVSADVRVALNRADGSGLYQPFLAPVAIGDESSPNEPADFDDDGKTDGCFSAADGQSVTVLLGAGDGTYASSQTIALGGAPHGIAVLDVDGDGDLDIVDANHGANGLALMRNDGHGVFGAPATFDGGVDGEYGLAAGDMNGDGITDLVVAGRDSEDIVTLLGNGDGTFTAAGPPTDSGGATWVIALGDVNGDGILDATTANAGSQNGAMLRGKGDGTFFPRVVMPTGAHTPSTDLGDLDGDGDLDWVLSSFGGGFWRLYVNDGDGVFTFDQEFTAPSNPSCAILYDFDDDGDLDMALTDEIADVILLERNGGTVAPTPTPLCATTPLPCRTPFVPRRSTLAITDATLSKRDALRWTWPKGAATTKADFGDPTTADGYDLCIYDGGTLVLGAAAPAGGVCPAKRCWKNRRTGFDYADRVRTPNGLAAIALRAGANGKARVAVSGKGAALPLPNLTTLAGPLDVQLQRRNGGACFGARYSAPFAKQTRAKLADKAD
jgi:FG-GAP-like repeat/Bacterial Ig-like domain